MIIPLENLISLQIAQLWDVIRNLYRLISGKFQAISDEDKNIDELLNFLVTFQNFLTLTLYKSTYPLSITLRGDKHKKNILMVR